MHGESLGIIPVAAALGYEDRIFDTSHVHTVDIVMDGWDSFIENAESEEYAACSVVIDGESYKNVAIRAKGNTSLSQVSRYGNDRYSFKIEFDHYDSGNSYYGLDKLVLNNLIQDNTMMKDYLVYQMMLASGAYAPLCSFAYITVNGEDFGLYLAVEAIEGSFLRRNFGNNYGNLYKPDGMNMGGGANRDEKLDMGNFEKPENFTPNMQNSGTRQPMQTEERTVRVGFGGMRGSGGALLSYTDDSFDSYSVIFNSAKTDIDDEDKTRLIASLKNLSTMTDIENTVDVDALMRYFAVHNFVLNFDSYTGSMIHNYYLYEENGVLSMLPWDYNLAFGSFQGGGNTEDYINYPIDEPTSGGDTSSRPMLAWIFASEEYADMYRSYLDGFVNSVFESGRFEGIIDNAYTIIAPYVEKDPTKFCTYEEFENGVKALREFCLRRAESVRGQLDGKIPSTKDGQGEESTNLVSGEGVVLSDMGSMGMGGGNRDGFARPSENQQQTDLKVMPQLEKPQEPSQGKEQTQLTDRSAEQDMPRRLQNNPLDRGVGRQNMSFADGTAPQEAQQSNTNNILIVASAAVLLFGLIFAGLYKRR